jgi:cytochrome c-type biogenesis protein
VEIYLGAFVAGVGATVTPCILPLYPGFLAYLTRRRSVSVGPSSGPGSASVAVAREGLSPAMAALLVWCGVVAGMVAIGATIAVLAAPLGDFNRVVLPVADGLLIALGVLLLAGVNPFTRLPQPSSDAFRGRGATLGAFLYGLLFAPLAVPCSGPFLVGIFAFSLTIGDALGRLAFFVAFGVGFGLPLFVIGSLGQVRGARLARAVSRHERPMQLILGVALLAVGVWDLSVNLPLIIG